MTLPPEGIPLFAPLGGAVMEAFGEPEPIALRRVAVGQTVMLDGLYNGQHFEVDGDGEASVSEYQVTVAFRRLDAEPVAYGDEVTVRGTIYAVRDISRDQEGWVVLDLKLAAGQSDNTPDVGIGLLDVVGNAVQAAFGEVIQAYWVRGPSDEVAVDLIFDGRAIETLLQGEAMVSDDLLTAQLRRDQVPGLTTAQQMRVRGVLFNVKDIRPDSEGWTVLDLEKV